MPVQAQYNSRSGANKFLLLAQGLCRLVNIAAPTIQGRYPDRPALQAVLVAAQGVCALLPAAMDEKAIADSMDPAAFDPSDATVIPGQDAV
jgi:hypothetical protein